jgi:hypothetical protein
VQRAYRDRPEPVPVAGEQLAEGGGITGRVAAEQLGV